MARIKFNKFGIEGDRNRAQPYYRNSTAVAKDQEKMSAVGDSRRKLKYMKEYKGFLSKNAQEWVLRLSDAFQKQDGNLSEPQKKVLQDLFKDAVDRSKNPVIPKPSIDLVKLAEVRKKLNL
jgi:hypothetical protein